MKHEITQEEYESVVKAEKETQNKRISKKLRVIRLRYEGYSNQAIGQMVDLHKDRVRHIVSEFKAQGLEEFIRCKYVGNHRSMSYEEELEILDSFAEKAHLGQITSVQEIKAAFDSKLGRETSGGYIYMLLTRHGWRRVKPRPKHPKAASAEACEASKKLNHVWRKSN
jgi:transposase